MDVYIKKLRDKFREIILNFEREMSAIRGSRPTPQLLENVKVSCYGQVLPLKQLGSLSVVPPREIIVNLWDKSILKTVVKAIEDAKLGLSLSDDGNVIRAALPVLSEERRKEFAKQVSKTAEEARIQVRRGRDDVNKEIKTAEEEGKLSEDQKFKVLKEIQEATEEINKKINSAADLKTEELMLQ
ncbi:ribosome recycling factor [Patescibacteria group bacterium]|nr:ribosome recycling factor [Patescibacteria group bacterium]